MPVSQLPDDFWVHDEATQTLSGRRTRVVFHLAQEVEVRLAEAAPVTGGLLFQILQGRDDRAPGAMSRAAPKAKPGAKPAKATKQAGAKQAGDRGKARPR